MSELSATARRAVEAAQAAGAGEAEAYTSREGGREVRVHGGEVESLTAATQTGIGIRAWSGQRVGYASAASFILFIVILIVSFVWLALVRRQESGV